MATKFKDFMQGIEDEAVAAGPDAVQELEDLRTHFRVGRQLAAARMNRKLTQTQVAQMAHVDQADVSKIERGATNPTLATLSAVALAVGMEIDVRKKSTSR